MTGEIILTGIVLGSMPVGDYDRRLSLLTLEKGRISAFAKGARRPMSSLRAVSRPFTYARFTAYAGRDSYTVTKYEQPVYFEELNKDFDKTYFGMYFCELMEHFTRENADEKSQVKLLYTALKALTKGYMPLKLVKSVFEIRAVANYGEAPNIFECSSCGKKESSQGWRFYTGLGRILCEDCAQHQKAGTTEQPLKISEAVRYTMHYCITAPYKTLFGFKLTPEVEKDFETAVGIYMKKHVDKTIKSLELLEGLGYNVD